MPNCPRCGFQVSFPQQLCSGCARDSECIDDSELAGRSSDGENVDAEPDRVAIARFQSGAEAGYFADELTRQTGIETDVLARERFDAVHAAWSLDYLLLVPAAASDEAPRLLQELVDATGDDLPDDERVAPPYSDLTAGAWVPLILTLAAGSIACFGIERHDHRPRPAALVVGDGRKPTELWDALGSDGGPWVQQLAGGHGTRELTLDRERQLIRLREDGDGDGHFDREWEFSRSAR
jgi:hypothetical protein